METVPLDIHKFKSKKRCLGIGRIGSVLLEFFRVYTIHHLSPVWDPHGIVVQEELEKVQNRAARFVIGNYNFEASNMTSILEQLG